MNIVIPMAGEGRRFADVGFKEPKPFIEVQGEPMIEKVINNLGYVDNHFIFLARKENVDRLQKLAERKSLLYTIIPVDKLTEGAACTALLAKDEIDNNEELLIANSDQLIYFNWDNFHSLRRITHCDGVIFVFNATDKKWSFVRLGYNGLIDQVKEKVPVSNIATCGVYYFKRGFQFVKAAEEMIQKNIRFNNEFYLAPCYNELIQAGGNIYPFFVDSMHGLGTPEDLKKYLEEYL